MTELQEQHAFERAQERWDNMMPEDDSAEELALERAIEAIESDTSEIMEAIEELDWEIVQTALAKMYQEAANFTWDGDEAERGILDVFFTELQPQMQAAIERMARSRLASGPAYLGEWE